MTPSDILDVAADSAKNIKFAVIVFMSKFRLSL